MTKPGIPGVPPGKGLPKSVDIPEDRYRSRRKPRNPLALPVIDPFKFDVDPDHIMAHFRKSQEYGF